jgi:hypothetical protein
VQLTIQVLELKV